MKSWRSLARTLPVLMLALFSLPKFVHARFDPLDPLGELRARGQVRAHIEVAPGDWGVADAGEVRLVLESVAREFLRHVDLARDDLRLRVVPRSDTPRVLYERGVDGQYVIQLTARDQRWFQYAYQFAHELCHVVSNFDRKAMAGDAVATDNQWFEEALCETAALFTLRRLDAAWESHPPKRDWIGYRKTFGNYAEHLMRQSHRHLPADQSLREWYAEHRAALEANPYLREDNEVVASELLPLFEAHPDYWRAIAYLNPDPASAAKPFAGYLADWHAAAPDKALPAEVLARFGFAAVGAISAHPGGPAPIARRAIGGASGPAGD